MFHFILDTSLIFPELSLSKAPARNLGKHRESFKTKNVTKFGKNWNVDIFEIIAPSLTLAKTVPKSYLTFTLGPIQSYISQIWSKCCPYFTNISPIYHQNKGHISVILIWEKVQTPLPHQKAVYILNCGLFDFQRFWTFLIWRVPLSKFR